jgi:cobalamin biosynthesis Mg chelatase CobN
MNASRIRLSLAATVVVALLTAPAAAGAEQAVVPPSNSAATQYTETFPTSGGDKKTDEKPRHRSPAKVLGKQNTQKLQKQGPEGQAAAEAAAATAPAPVATPPQPAPTPSKPSSGGNGSPNGGQSHSGGGANTPQAESGESTAPPPAPEPAGSSGIGAAIGQATGLSSAGASGPLLPLLILATLVWSLAYLWRQRRQTD